MKQDSLPQSHSQQLAQRLEADIRRRRLIPGQRYLTAEKAAAQLGVSRMTAHRVMNLLVERDLLVRQQGRGTFVGPAAGSSLPHRKVTHVHLIGCFEGEASAKMIPSELLLPGLRQVIPDAILHSHTFPFDDAKWHVGELLSESRSDEAAPTAVILTLSSREVQEIVAQRGIPTVVIGSVFPGISLPHFESDQFEVGNQMLGVAHQLGGRRFTFVHRERWRQGDLTAFDGMLTALTQTGLRPNQIRVRNFPGEETVTRQIFEELIRETCQDRSAPKPALLCRGVQTAQLLLETADSLGLRVPDDFAVVYSRSWTERTSLPIPAIEDIATNEACILTVARMLQNQLDDSSAEGGHHLLPVKVVMPDSMLLT